MSAAMEVLGCVVFTERRLPSVQLARRVLQLERINASLRRELEEQRKGTERLCEEVRGLEIALFTA